MGSHSRRRPYEARLEDFHVGITCTLQPGLLGSSPWSTWMVTGARRSARTRSGASWWWPSQTDHRKCGEHAEGGTV